MTPPETPRTHRARVRKVQLRNYRSIKACAVELGDLSVLVGPNGAGKSNFLDGIQFMRDALRTTLESALRERGGLSSVRRHSTGHPHNFAIRLDLTLPSGALADYVIEVTSTEGAVEVRRERCQISTADNRKISFNRTPQSFNATSGVIKVAMSSNSLALPTLSAQEGFSEVYETITNFGFYNINPDSVRSLQDPDPGELLELNGGNLSSVLRSIERTDPELLERIIGYVSSVVPGIRGVAFTEYGPKETFEFKQDVEGSKRPWTFPASSASDGTARAISVIVAALQPDSRYGPVSLVAIEEPELAVHPGAAARIMDALIEASADRQIIITTHSPDLLDHPELRPEWILSVQSEAGRTNIGPIDDGTADAVKKNLYTVGELLRLDQISTDLYGEADLQLRLFS